MLLDERTLCLHDVLRTQLRETYAWVYDCSALR